MAALDFPSAPAIGQQFTSGTTTWQWDGVAWNIVPLITPPIADDDPPADPYNGQLWWNAENGNLYVWYDDGNSAQWVQTAGYTGAAYRTAEARNRIRNPAMQISQENGDTASVANTYYLADQWITSWSSAVGQAGSGRVVSASPNGSKYALHAYVNAADTSLATEWLGINQPIEGTDIADFKWGTADAQQAVLRFWAFANTAGTYGGAIRSTTVSRTFVFDFTLPANQWTEVVKVIPGDTGGPAWATDNTKAGELWFTWAASAVQCGAPGWQAGAAIGATGQRNGFDTVANHFYIADTGLYKDPLKTGKPPPWQIPDYADELVRCQRYWEIGDSRFDGYGVTGTFNSETVPFSVTKRTVPVCAILAGATASNMGTSTVDMATMASFRTFRQVAATGNCAWSQAWTANARM